MPQLDGAVLHELVTGHPDRAPHELVFLGRPGGGAARLACRHLRHEREAADVLGIPFKAVVEAALIPVAYTVGTDFRPVARHPLDTMVHWDQ